jgi:hypothetical protein
MEHLSEYSQAVSATICAKCIDGNGDGRCRINGEQECSVIAHLPKIVETVFSVESDRLEPYIQALRENVCATCQYQGVDEACTVRNNVDCALDRYFPMIVEILQETRLHLNQTIEAIEN